MKIQTRYRGLALSMLAVNSPFPPPSISPISAVSRPIRTTRHPTNRAALLSDAAHDGRHDVRVFAAVNSLTGLLTSPGTGTDKGLNTAWALHGSSYMNTDAAVLAMFTKSNPDLKITSRARVMP